MKPETPLSNIINTASTQLDWLFFTEEDGISVCCIITKKEHTNY